MSADSSAYLRIRNLEKHFGAFSALRNISLDIQQGEFVCFLGPSGCGKTTLLRAIAGLDFQTAGQIFQNGREISHLPPAERDFGIVFQSYALFPNLTINDNVAYGLHSRRRPRAETQARVAELLALVGLKEQGTKYPAQLSGGQQQRVALARAIATSPGLLLLDEPLSALDARVRVRLRHEIKELQRRLGVTTIMVTHDQEEALTMADRIVVMNHGVIEQVGTPLEVYGAPATAFVADFVGTMNFMVGRVSGAEQVAMGPVLLDCPDARHFKQGEEVRVCIRPEDVKVRNITAETGNRLRATIHDLDYLGSFCRAELDIANVGPAPLMADFSLNLMRDLDIAVGQQLEIALPSDRLRVFSAAQAEG